jgi:hypothetical protein
MTSLKPLTQGPVNVVAGNGGSKPRHRDDIIVLATETVGAHEVSTMMKSQVIEISPYAKVALSVPVGADGLQSYLCILGDDEMSFESLCTDAGDKDHPARILVANQLKKERHLMLKWL